MRPFPLRVLGIAAAVACGLALLLPAVAQEAAECRVGTVAVSFSGRQLRVDAGLNPGLPPETVQRLASGLPTTTSWDVRLYVDRGFFFFWPDGLKDSRRYDVTATYRPVTSDYSVERRLDGKLLEARTVAAKGSALEALEGVRALPAFQMGPHLLGKDLYVKVRCSYGTGVALGLVPTSSATGWTRSEGFTWTGEKD